MLQSPVPQIPPQPADGDGSALMFAAFIGLIFLGCSAMVVMLINSVAKAAKTSESTRNIASIAGVLLCVLAAWYYWAPLRDLVLPIAEWSWTGLLLLFIVVAIIIALAAIGSGLKSSFSGENLAGTISLIAIVAGTSFMYSSWSWNFWLALGVSFGVVLAINIAGVILKRANDTDQDQT